MAILAGVQCDKCGRSVMWQHSSKFWIIKWSRTRGWQIGKHVTCPDCVDAKRKPPSDGNRKGGK